MRDHAFDLQGVPIVYRQHTGKTVSVSGTITNTYTDTSIARALIGPLLTGFVSPSERYVDADLSVRVRKADLPEYPPSLNSRIVDSSGREWAVASHAIDRTHTIVDLACREIRDR